MQQTGPVSLIRHDREAFLGGRLRKAVSDKQKPRSPRDGRRQSRRPPVALHRRREASGCATSVKRVPTDMDSGNFSRCGSAGSGAAVNSPAVTCARAPDGTITTRTKGCCPPDGQVRVCRIQRFESLVRQLARKPGNERRAIPKFHLKKVGRVATSGDRTPASRIDARAGERRPHRPCRRHSGRAGRLVPWRAGYARQRPAEDQPCLRSHRD